MNPETDAAAGADPGGSDGSGGEEVLRWYVLKVQSNREKSIRDNIIAGRSLTGDAVAL